MQDKKPAVTFDAAAVTTGTVDGTDVSAYENPGVNRAIIQNYVQIFQRTIRVSPLSLEISTVAGLKDELSAGIAKKLVNYFCVSY